MSPRNLHPVAWLIAATTLLRLAFAATTGLGVDESYMVTAGRVLSLGYFDHPPASWWLSWGAAHLLGTEAPWAVRLPFVLLFAVSQGLVWRIGCLVANRQAAFWGVVALTVSPVFGVTTGCWVLPDGPLDAALLGAAYCLLRALPDRGFGWWAGTGACAGLAMFSKYSAVLTIGGAFLYLAFSADHRPWLRRWEPYAAAAVAFLVFCPVVVWNGMHGWASFAFQGDRAVGLRWRLWMPLQVLGGEALFVLPWVWVAMIVALVRGFAREVRWEKRLLAWLAVPPIAGFALISAWSSQRILFHWAAPGYLMLFPLLGAVAWLRRWVAASAGLVLAAVLVIACQVQFDFLGTALAQVMRNDPTAEAVDWTSLRNDLQARGLLAPGTVVAALNWRDAGKIGYGLGADVVTLCLSQDARQFGIAEPAAAFAGQDVLVLAVDPVSPDVVIRWFRRVEVLPPVSVRLDGRVLRTVSVFRGMGLR